jgi:AcrR family transcriptional regulator
MTLSYDSIISVSPQHGATRADIVEVARRVLEDEGVEAVTMRRLAAELGTSYQVVYSRVGGKPDVLRAVHDDGFRRLADPTSASAAPPSPGGAAQALGRVAVAYLDFAVAGPRLFDVMFGDPAPGLERDEGMREVERAAFRVCWVVPTRAWLDANHPRRPRGSASRLAWRLWSAVHGITVLHLAGHETPSGDVRAEVVQVVDLLVADPIRP